MYFRYHLLMEFLMQLQVTRNILMGIVVIIRLGCTRKIKRRQLNGVGCIRGSSNDVQLEDNTNYISQSHPRDFCRLYTSIYVGIFE